MNAYLYFETPRIKKTLGLLLSSMWFTGDGNPEAEPGARLTCHLLLRILKNVESPQPSQYAAGNHDSSLFFLCFVIINNK